MRNRIFQILVIGFMVAMLYMVANVWQSIPPRSHEIVTLRSLNNRTAGHLHSLVKTKFFRILRLNLHSECPLPYMDKLCKSKSCSVCRCDQKDIPQNWITTDKVVSREKGKDQWSKQRERSPPGQWVWHVEDEENDQGEYFDVNRNVESFSGYNGSYIWSLIYEENCFKGINHFTEMCLEEQILYKIISGLHTSISSHLSRLFKNVTKAPVWADKGDSDNFFFNHIEYNERVLSHRDRIDNMLFLYEMLLRSVKEIIPYLEQNNFIISDNTTEDLESKFLLTHIVQELKKVEFKPINETDASFFESNNPHIKQYQRYIHNISNILNCVDCEKCRLFGKMQTYGLGTALKILLGYNTDYKRNEIVALFNTFNKISLSVNTYFNYKSFLGEGVGGASYQNLDFSKIYGIEEDPYVMVKVYGACGLIFLVFMWIALQWDPAAKIKKQFKHAFPPQPKPKRQ